MLASYGIPVVETRLALTEQEAVKAAARSAIPVVVKLHSLTITHKTDVGGVMLNLHDAEAVRQGIPPDPAVRGGEGRRRTFSGCDGSADGQASMATS